MDTPWVSTIHPLVCSVLDGRAGRARCKLGFLDRLRWTGLFFFLVRQSKCSAPPAILYTDKGGHHRNVLNRQALASGALYCRPHRVARNAILAALHNEILAPNTERYQKAQQRRQNSVGWHLHRVTRPATTRPWDKGVEGKWGLSLGWHQTKWHMVCPAEPINVDTEGRVVGVRAAA